MKRLSFLLIFCAISILNFAQNEADTTYWKKGGNYAFNFTQVSLTNWSAGGQNSVSGVTKLQLFANYKEGNTSWDNLIDLGYGLSKVENLALQKNEDIIDLQSKLGIKASKFLNYSASLSLKSQFAPGYSDETNTVITSNLFAPAFITLAVGMDYKPNDIISLMVAPLTGKITIIGDKVIDSRTYGLESEDALTRMEFGASLKTLINTKIIKNVGLTSELGLFTNYLNNPQNIDVDWKVGINMKINDYLSAQVDTRLLYDADIVEAGAEKAKIQFKELLGIGLNFKF